MQATQFRGGMPIDADERDDPTQWQPIADARSQKFGRKEFGRRTVRVIDRLRLGCRIEHPPAECRLHEIRRIQTHRAIAWNSERAFLIRQTDRFDIADESRGADRARDRAQFGN